MFPITVKKKNDHSTLTWLLMFTAEMSPSCCIEALTPRGSTVSTLVSIATGELHLRGSLGLKEGKFRV